MTGRVDNGWGSWYWSACARALLGDHENAIAALERSAQATNLACGPVTRCRLLRSLQ